VPRLHVDWTRCDGHGLCAELLPELLDRDEWGYPMPRTTWDLEPGLMEHAQHAIKTCPLLALKIVDG
jgi:ferredoxin